MNWFRVKAPDKGSGSTNISLYAQGNNKEDAKCVLQECGRYNIYDFSNPQLVNKQNKTTEEIQEKVASIGNPNEMIHNDGSVFVRNTDGDTKVRKIDV